MTDADNYKMPGADNFSDNRIEIITEPPNANNNTSEILAGGSEFELENDFEVNTRNSSSLSQEKEVLEGGGVSPRLIEYKINYLLPDDEHLINPDKIKSTVQRYIDNYYSDAMKKYKQLFKIVYQKYSSKRYLIDNTDSDIIVSRVSVQTSSRDSKNVKRDIVYEISKPKYIFYNKDNNLIYMKSTISNKRLELQIHYQSLVNKLDVQPEEKKQFEKERKQFIDLLERYYIYDLYNHQINNISLDGKSNIIVQEMHGFLKDNAEKKFILDSNLYTIDNALIERINTNNSSRLNIYNELMIKLQSAKSTTSSSALSSSSGSTSISEKPEKSETSIKTDKAVKSKTEKSKADKLIDEIKEYLKSNEENTKLNNEIKDVIRIQNTYIDYIIYKLPNN